MKFLSDDGKIFATKKDCLEYEERLDGEKIDKTYAEYLNTRKKASDLRKNFDAAFEHYTKKYKKARFPVITITKDGFKSFLDVLDDLDK